MTRYRVELVKSAKKEFDRLSQNVQDRILDALNLLSVNPFSSVLDIKKLKGYDLYRLRVGNFRIVYEVRRSIVTIVVIKIGDRKDVYRQL